ncbi:MAG: hypothetical protein AAFP02_06480 [Bacteroidota bacterium]
MKHLLSLSFALLMFATTFGQRQIIPELHFLQDSIRVGEAVPLELKVIHPKEIAVIFPNHSANFRPFELVDFQAKPTVFTGKMATDVAVYEVKSFDIEEIQTLQLRFGTIAGTDTNWQHQVSSDSIFFAASLPMEYEELSYQRFEELIALKEPANYSGLIIVLTAAILIIGLLLLIMRRPIQRYLAVRSLSLEWQGIRRQLKKLSQVHDQRVFFPAINKLWKGYLDPKNQLSLLSLTTTELRTEISKLTYLTAEHQQNLIRTAVAADQVIYAGHAVEGLSAQEISQRIQKVLKTVFEIRKKALLERKKSA